MKIITTILGVKLLIINCLIFAFGFGGYELLKNALRLDNPTYLITIMPLALAIVALITFEIKMVFNIIKAILKNKVEPKITLIKKEKKHVK